MKLKFDVTAKEYGILRDILTDMLPPDSRVWVFGSRAKNTVRFNSDIDLALEPAKGKPLPKGTLARLKDAFNDATLPYRVDVLDINDVSENFQTIIRQQAIAFPLAKSTKVPKLRFSEFSGEWEKKALGEVGHVSMCKRIFKHETAPAGDVPFYKIGTFGRNADAFISLELYEDYRRKYPFPKKGDILISAAGTIARLVVYEGLPAYFQDSNIVWIANDEREVENAFLLCCYKNTRWTTEDTTIARLYNDNLRKMTIAVPTFPEQQKIASFLSAIDTKIAQITKKKNLLEQYKRGVVQQLFSQELRFKDAQGQAFPDWVEKRLGEVAEKTASTVTAQSLGKTPGEYPVFGASGVAGYVDFYNSKIPHISVVKDGAGVGRVFLCPEKSSVLGTLDSIVAKAGNITGFVYYWLAKISFEPYKTGSTIPHVYYRDYSKKKSLFPKNVEQQKIADFLSAIDRKIDLVDTELYHAKTFKKGLLQQMFV